MNSVTFITPGYPSKDRQVYVFVEQLVNEFVKTGIKVNVIAPQSVTHAVIHRECLLHKKSKHTTRNGLDYDVYRPYMISLADHFPRFENILNRFFKQRLNKLLHKLNSDVLYCHFWNSTKFIYDFALKEKKPMFVACGEGDNAIELMLDVCTNEELRKLKSATTGVISVSTENKQKCLLYGLASEHNIAVFPNCVDDSLFHVCDGMGKRRELNVATNDFLVMFVGNFIHRKGPDRVSEAIKNLHDKNIKAIFVGKPFDHENVNPNCEGIVHKGTINHDKLPEYLNAADLFVLPTLNEGCCNAIVEALSCGTPVVSSNRSFNEDILNDGNSILVDPENIDEISEAIRIMKNDKEFYKKKKTYTVEHSDNYSISMRANKIINFIDSLI